SDRGWLHALCAPRFGSGRFEPLLAQRAGLEIARGMRADVVDILAAAPRDRAALLAELAKRGHRELAPRALNLFVPWLAMQGLVVGLPNARLRPAEPPPRAKPDEALPPMAPRTLPGTAPAPPPDFPAGPGLPLGSPRAGSTATA